VRVFQSPSRNWAIGSVEKFSVFGFQGAGVSGQWSVISYQFSVFGFRFSVGSEGAVRGQGLRDCFRFARRGTEFGVLGECFFRRGKTRKNAEEHGQSHGVLAGGVGGGVGVVGRGDFSTTNDTNHTNEDEDVLRT